MLKGSWELCLAYVCCIVNLSFFTAVLLGLQFIILPLACCIAAYIIRFFSVYYRLIIPLNIALRCGLVFWIAIQCR